MPEEKPAAATSAWDTEVVTPIAPQRPSITAQPKVGQMRTAALSPQEQDETLTEPLPIRELDTGAPAVLKQPQANRKRPAAAAPVVIVKPPRVIRSAPARREARAPSRPRASYRNSYRARSVQNLFMHPLGRM